ncbi:MAG: E2/UBC family protein [Gammaproteobacteria bacterium]
MSAKELLEKHAEELGSITGLMIEVIQDANRLFIFLHDYSLPCGVSRVERTDVLFIADFQYPLSAMDMFWTDVAVVRLGGSLFENSDAIEDYVGRKWRRFSYHRNNVWNPTGNPLLDHFAFMETRWTGKALR